MRLTQQRPTLGVKLSDSAGIGSRVNIALRPDRKVSWNMETDEIIYNVLIFTRQLVDPKLLRVTSRVQL